MRDYYSIDGQFTVLLKDIHRLHKSVLEGIEMEEQLL